MGVVALPAHRPHMLLTSVLVGMNLEKSLFCLLFLFLNALVANSEQEQHRVRDVAEEETELVVAAIYKGESKKHAEHLKRMSESLLQHTEDPLLRILILSDQASWPEAKLIVEESFGQHLTEQFVFGYQPARVRLQFVDLDRLTERIDRKLLNTMKQLFGPKNKTIVVGPKDPRRSLFASQMQLADDEDPTMVYPSRFDHDLFYVAPFYHELFPDIDKIIVLDLDLEFRPGVGKLADLFSFMSSNQLVAMVEDQSGHYPFLTGASPKPRNGLNSGVALYDLKGMRESSEYREELSGEKMEELALSFLPSYDWSLAEQDWFSLLYWSKPHLVGALPCRYNVLSCNVLSEGLPAYPNFPCREESLITHYCGMS